MKTPKVDADDTAMTQDEVAAYLRVHRVTISRLVAKGLLHPFKTGTGWRFNQIDVLALTQESRSTPHRGRGRKRK
jgi:excisionase family DNA binding protein